MDGLKAGGMGVWLHGPTCQSLRNEDGFGNSLINDLSALKNLLRIAAGNLWTL